MHLPSVTAHFTTSQDGSVDSRSDQHAGRTAHSLDRFHLDFCSVSEQVLVGSDSVPKTQIIRLTSGSTETASLARPTIVRRAAAARPQILLDFRANSNSSSRYIPLSIVLSHFTPS